jgi:threonine 3-dehydrogenase
MSTRVTTAAEPAEPEAKPSAGDTMRAVWKRRPGPGLEVGRAPIPSLGPRDVLLKVRATSVCGTDTHIVAWDEWASHRLHPPIIFGHEVCGTVVEMGRDVTGLAPGDFVSVESHIPCERCHQCLTGQRHICRNLKILGVDVQGTFAEYVVVPAICAWKNPLDLKPEIASIMEPLGNAVYATLVEPVVGKRVAILGGGPIGLWSIGVAKAAGAHQVLMTIKQEYSRALAEAMGADAVYQVDDVDPVAAVLEATGGDGVDVVLEMSGAPAAIHQGLEMLTKGGRFTAFGIPPGAVEIDLSRQVIFKGARIIGINGRLMFDTWVQMAGMLESGALDPTPVITHTLPLEEINHAIKMMTSPERECGKVVLVP